VPRILVTYATYYGSTREIADAIGEELAAKGFDVDVLNANPGIDLRKYDAVIAGAPAYGEKWLPSAALFVVGNAEDMARLPVALFTAGMMGVKSPKSALREHNRIIAGLQELTPGLAPVSTALFHGSFSRARLPLCLRIMDVLAGTPQGDRRDWGAIRGWAQRVGDAFSERLAAGNGAMPEGDAE
jgi:menaquinone-dependent protoporphyrinogen oxidase